MEHTTTSDGKIVAVGDIRVQGDRQFTCKPVVRGTYEIDLKIGEEARLLAETESPSRPHDGDNQSEPAMESRHQSGPSGDSRQSLDRVFPAAEFEGQHLSLLQWRKP
jgi:hypothetical protein